MNKIVFCYERNVFRQKAVMKMQV